MDRLCEAGVPVRLTTGTCAKAPRPAADTDSFDITQLLCWPSKLERIDPMMDYCDRGASRIEHSLD